MTHVSMYDTVWTTQPQCLLPQQQSLKCSCKTESLYRGHLGSKNVEQRPMPIEEPVQVCKLKFSDSKSRCVNTGYDRL